MTSPLCFLCHQIVTDTCLILIAVVVELPHHTATPQCRLEATYAHERDICMIPLMMQENYMPR